MTLTLPGYRRNTSRRLPVAVVQAGQRAELYHFYATDPAQRAARYACAAVVAGEVVAVAYERESHDACRMTMRLLDGTPLFPCPAVDPLSPEYAP